MLNLGSMTERCENLERLQKVVSAQLSFNVMNNSEHFIEGMNTVKHLSDDLSRVKEITRNQKEAITYVREKILVNTIRSLALERKKRRLVLARKMVHEVILRLV